MDHCTPPGDLDVSRRWLREEKFERRRVFAAKRFPGVAGASLSECRARHREVSAKGEPLP